MPAIALTWLAFVKEGQKDLALTLLVIAVGIDAAVYSGFNVNHLDLAPNYGGILMGITNSLSNILSIVAPLSLNVMGHEEVTYKKCGTILKLLLITRMTQYYGGLCFVFLRE